MLKITKYAAVDIGSNAIRLLIASVTETPGEKPRFKKISLVRVPIRLGADVFVTGEISEDNIDRMIQTMNAYQLLMNVHKVKEYKAFATSAMREAENGAEVAQFIKERTGISIDIIDGSHEAAIIAMTDLHNLVKDHKSYLYVDVGGGSTEFTMFNNGVKEASRSFKLGTVRLLNDMVPRSTWDAAQEWVHTHTKDKRTVNLIGSGGNINHIFKHSNKPAGKPLSYFYLTSYYEQLQSYSYEERIIELKMNHDRADVVLPATRIYLSAMKWCNAKSIYVPKIGLTDGIIKSLYLEDQETLITK